jgi:hypothetical protein
LEIQVICGFEAQMRCFEICKSPIKFSYIFKIEHSR